MNKIIVSILIICTLLIGSVTVPAVISNEKRIQPVMNEPISVTVDLHQDELQQNEDIHVTVDLSQNEIQENEPISVTVDLSKESPQKEFTDHFTDQPPNVPNDPYPDNGETNVRLFHSGNGAYENLKFMWYGGDPDGDLVTYNLFFGIDNPPDTCILSLHNQPGDGVFLQMCWVDELAHYNTEYYWQIIADDGHRGVTEGPVWSFTTELMYPPINPFPSDESTDISVGDTIILGYEMAHPNPQDVWLLTKISMNSDMSNPLYDTSTGPFYAEDTYTSVSGNHFFITEYDTTYYWQAGIRDSDDEVIYGDIWSFTTENYPTISGTIYYEGNLDSTIYVYEDYSGLMCTITPPPKRDGSISYSFEVPNGRYYVSAFMDDNDNGVHDNGEQIGKVWSIDVDGENVIVDITMAPNNKPTVPTYILPLDGAVDIPVGEEISLTWNPCSDPDGDDVFYRVHFSPYDNPDVVGKIHAPTEFFTTIPIYSNWVNKDIYWKIVACDWNGCESSGPIWSFHTEGVPYEPQNPEPFDGCANIDIDGGPMISWETGHPVPLQLKHHIYFGTNPSPSLHGTTGWFTLTDDNYHKYTSNLGITLSYDTTYYWKIITEDYYQAQTEGPVWSFTTESDPELNQPPYKPEIGYPDYETDIPVPDEGEEFTFLWSCDDPEDDLLRYRMFFGESMDNLDDLGYVSGFIPEGDASATFIQDQTGWHLNYNTRYYWRIDVEDDYGNQEIGRLWVFTTEQLYNIDGTIYYTGEKTGTLCIAVFDENGIGNSDLIDSIRISEPYTFPIDYEFQVLNGEYYVFAFIDVVPGDGEPDDPDAPNIDIDPIGVAINQTLIFGEMPEISCTILNADELDVDITLSMIYENMNSISGTIYYEGEESSLIYVAAINYIEIEDDRKIVEYCCNSKNPFLTMVILDEPGDYTLYAPNGEYVIFAWMDVNGDEEPGIDDEFLIDIEPCGVAINKTIIDAMFLDNFDLAVVNDNDVQDMHITLFEPNLISGTISYNGPEQGILYVGVFVDGFSVEIRDPGFEPVYGIEIGEFTGTTMRYRIPVYNGEWYIGAFIDVIPNDIHEEPNPDVDPIGFWESEISINNNNVGNIDFTLKHLPSITEAYSCASHTGISYDIKLPIDFDSEFGVVEPRDQIIHPHIKENGIYTEIIFDCDVTLSDITIIVYPPLQFVVEQSADNIIKIHYTSFIPDGIYKITILENNIPPLFPIGVFNISYFNGDVNGDGVVNTKDVMEIVTPYNWQRHLDDHTSRPFGDPRCDINRNGIIEGLDIARIFNSANWLQTL